jgi:hypothetical protein
LCRYLADKVAYYNPGTVIALGTWLSHDVVGIIKVKLVRGNNTCETMRESGGPIHHTS